MLSEFWSLKGRVAVITGGSRNIGLEAAKLLSSAGASIVLNSFNRDLLEKAAEQVRAEGGAVATVAGDICGDAVCDAISTAALQTFGGADIIVNNALIDGGTDALPLLDTSRQSWDRKFAGYVHAPIRLLNGLKDSMRARGHGAVVNVISGVAFTPVTGMGAYGVAKAAMYAMTRQMARELAPEIRVNAVCPGTTSPDGKLIHEGMRPLLKHVPLKRLGLAEETARAIYFMASDASSYTTGNVLFADGGRAELISPE